MFSNYLNVVLADPLLSGIMAILTILSIVYLLKKLFKMAMILLAVISILAIYLIFTSDAPANDMKQIYHEGKEGITRIKNKAKEVSDIIDKELDEREIKKVLDNFLEQEHSTPKDTLPSKLPGKTDPQKRSQYFWTFS